MDNNEILKLKKNVTKFIEEISEMKNNVNTLIKSFSKSNESEIINERIKLLKELSATLTMDSSIEDYLMIEDLVEEINKMVFDLDYEITGENPELPEFEIPTISSIYLSENNKSAVVIAQGVSDPDNRLKTVDYKLMDSNDNVVQENKGLPATQEHVFPNKIEAGTYYSQGTFTYEGKDKNETINVTSNTLTVEDEVIVIDPTIGGITATVVEENKVSVVASGITDPQSRLTTVNYSLFNNNNTLVEEIQNQNVNAAVTFKTELEEGSYIALGEFSYRNENNLISTISKNSNTVVVEDKEEPITPPVGDYVASLNLTSDGGWDTGFNCDLEVASHVETDFGSDWELSFETALTSFSQWQITANAAANVMTIISGKDWKGDGHFQLGPKGGFKIAGINAGAVKFSETIIKNAKINGLPVKIYINGKEQEGQEPGTPGYNFPETNPISDSFPVAGLAIDSNEEFVMGSIVIPESDLHTKYAVYVNNKKAEELSAVAMKTSNTIVNVQLPITSLPVKAGSNTISLAFRNSDEAETIRVYETNEVNYEKALPELPTKDLVGYWSSWGGNGPTEYIDLEATPEEYGTIVVSFIEHADAGGVIPVFDPTQSGQVTVEEFKSKVQRMQAKGKKVIIAIGGQNGVFRLKSEADKITFRNGVIDIIEQYGFDGYDIDLEGGSIGGSYDYTYMLDATREIIEHFRVTNPNFIYSMAPEVAYLITAGFGDYYIRTIKEHMDIITYIHPQYYNAPGTGVFPFDGSGVMVCTSNDPAEQSKFITEFTHALTLGHDGPGWGSDKAQTFPIGPIPEEKLVIGLPSGTGAAGTGAVDDMEAIRRGYEELVIRGFTNIKGFMTWSIDWDKYHNWQFKNLIASL